MSDIDLYYTDTGAGDTALVFIHYFGGSSGTWAKVIAQLHSRFRCVAVDLPGFGRSAEASGDLSVARCAGAIDGLIRRLALKRYLLIGHSMGGKIAACMAWMPQPGLAGLMLAAPSPPAGEPMKEQDRKELLEAHGNAYALEKLLLKVASASLGESDLEETVADNVRVAFSSWRWWLKEGSRENIAVGMPVIKVPALIVNGGLDPKFSLNFLQSEMQLYFDRPVFREIEQSGHLLPLEAPDALTEWIRKFSVSIKD